MSAVALRVSGLTVAVPDPAATSARSLPGLPGSPGSGWLHPLVEVDLTLLTGRVTALVGESGAGKTMLVSAVTGLLPAKAHHRGSAVLAATRPAHDSAAGGEQPEVDLLTAGERTLARYVRGRRIGVVPQSAQSAFTPVRTVEAQLLEACLIAVSGSAAHRWRPLPVVGAARAGRRRAARARLDEVVRATGLDGVPLGVYPHQLSGGQLRRAAVAAGVAGGARVVLADEPTVGLDPGLVERASEHLAALARSGCAVLVVTHDLQVAASADDVVVLRAGRVVEAGPAAAVMTSPQHSYTQALLRARAGLTLRRVPRQRGAREEAA